MKVALLDIGSEKVLAGVSATVQMENGTWKRAGDLQPGDQIRGAGGLATLAKEDNSAMQTLNQATFASRARANLLLLRIYRAESIDPQIKEAADQLQKQLEAESGRHLGWLRGITVMAFGLGLHFAGMRTDGFWFWLFGVMLLIYGHLSRTDARRL